MQYSSDDMSVHMYSAQDILVSKWSFVGWYPAISSEAILFPYQEFLLFTKTATPEPSENLPEVVNNDTSQWKVCKDNWYCEQNLPP